METIFSLVRSCLTLLLLLLVLSYLAPKESYKKYFQFFIGVWMCVLLLRPIFGVLRDTDSVEQSGKDAVLESITEVKNWQKEEGQLYELFEADTEEER